MVLQWLNPDIYLNLQQKVDWATMQNESHEGRTEKKQARAFENVFF